MREPARIPIILDRIKEIWEQDPDLRLGQLILIACQNKTPVWPDVFSVEGDALLAGLEGIRAANPVPTRTFGQR